MRTTETLSIEDLGSTMNGSVDVELEYAYDPGEREVRYYPDGDGSPGYAENVDIVGVKVLEYASDGLLVRRDGNEDWFGLLDVIALRIIVSKSAEYEGDILAAIWERRQPCEE